jgi:hypothetical protein
LDTNITLPTLPTSNITLPTFPILPLSPNMTKIINETSKIMPNNHTNIITGISCAFAISILINIVLIIFIFLKFKKRDNLQTSNEDENISNVPPIVPPRPENTFYLQIQPNHEGEQQGVESDQSLVYDYVTAPVELYQDAHGESHMNEGRAVDEAQAADVAQNEPIQYDYVTAPVKLQNFPR